MLHHVRMDVQVPHDVDADRFQRPRVEETVCALDLQRRGKWRHVWRVGRPVSNVSIFDVADHDELHALPSTLPLFPFMRIAVMRLTGHPSAIEQARGRGRR
jgi:muconolactone D-isomerase